MPKKLLVGLSILSTAFFSSLSINAHAESNNIQQNCLLEGKVTRTEKKGKSVVYIDFYKAEPYKPDYRCIINGRLAFKQPKGSLIENLSEGSVVQYQYIKFKDGKTSWQLVGAFI